MRRLAMTVVLLVAGSPAMASPPLHLDTLENSAQRIHRYYQQQKPPPEKPRNPVLQKKQAVSKPPAKPPGRVSFVLKQVVFTPSKLLTQAELHNAVKPFVGHAVTRADLSRMLTSINALYAKHHITTARALLQNQTIANGVLHVELVEGRLGKLDINGANHLRNGFIRSRLAVKRGEVVNSDRLGEDLVFINQTTNLQVRALLAPGARRGQTDIRLQVEEPPWHRFGVFVDNQGVESTGRYRIGVQGYLYGLLGMDDKLDANIAHSRGGNEGSIGYSLLVNSADGRLGVNFARSQINIIDKAYRNLDITGASSVASLDYQQPFIATLNWQLTGIGAYSITQSDTHISGRKIADTTSHTMTLGLSVGHQSEGQRWNITQLVNRVRSDEPKLGESSFTIASGTAFIIQRLGQSRWAFKAAAGWQLSSTGDLASANLFQIGGVGSVRGYERGVLAGARGYYLDLELHRAFRNHLDLFAFIDYGLVHSEYPDDVRITGAGVGAVWRHDWFSLSADVARPFKTVIPDQNGVRVDLRLTARFD